MRFLLVFVLSFVSLFAIAQAPPMVLGGPQGINVTKALVTSWLSVPTYADTPIANPGPGPSPWPGKGYVVQVVKSGDTSIWQYTGQRWARIGGAAQSLFTRLITGGNVSKIGSTRDYEVSISTYIINGVNYVLNVPDTVTSASKTPNANGRIDVITLTSSGAEIVQGTEASVPIKPSVGPNRIELSAIYYRAFDTVPSIIGSGITSVFRKPGVDSLYFSSTNSTIAVKDSIGVSGNDTASMLNNYKFTAANGLTKDSTVFRLGGSLNQNTNINLNTRRLTIIGGIDTTRFFSNGRVSIGGTTDSLSMLRVNGTTRITGNTTYNGNLLPLATPGGGLVVAGFTRGANTNDPAKLQVYTNGGASVIQSLDFDFLQTTLNSVNKFDTTAFDYDLNKFRTIGEITSINGGGTAVTDIRMSPTFRVGPRSTDTSTYYGARFVPIVDSANKVNIIPFSNTIGSNMFNTTSGNTRIGYPYAFQTPNQFDTTFKLDVNGKARVRDTLTLSTIPVTADTSANDLLVINSSNGQVRRFTGDWYSVPLTGSATLNFPSTGHGNSADLTFTLTGAAEGDVVALGIPNASIVANGSFIAWVSATDTITVRFNNYASSGNSDPENGTFKIKVFK